ncbi:MAG: alpha/beta hydrolase [Verrucomicrobia bacterium]|nr:alpha/beta hydrolase [Verrucomicrobiota bacterium]
MSITTSLLIALLGVEALTAQAQLPEINLWPAGMPEPAVLAEPPEKVEKGADGTSRRYNVSQPRLFVHEPPAGVTRTGVAVVVVPGGGFSKLADEHEGSDACVWLAKQGIVAFQLAHRTPTTQHKEPHAGPAQDVQRAVSEVRRRATELKVDSKRIGVLGFSAGGQVSLIAATNEPLFPSEPAAVSHRPDFFLLIYPYKIYDPATKAIRADIRLSAGLPPTFIAQAGDDTGSLPQGSTLLYLDLITRKIPAEIHIYEKGGHGFGMRPRPNATGPTDWPLRAADWLRLRGLAAK